MFKKFTVLFFAFTLSAAMLQPAAAAEKDQVIAGAGPSTKVVEIFAKKFSEKPAAKGYSFEVPQKSAKHAGGIANSDKYIFGRTGRPLTEGEKAPGKEEIILARIPIVIGTGEKAGVKELSIEKLEAIYTGGIHNWQEVGGADHEIVTVGREQTEALFSVLKKSYPFFKEADFDKVFKKDHEVVNFLKSEAGAYAIGFGAEPNFFSGGISMVKTKGLAAGVEIGLVYDLKNSDHPLVKAAKDYASSKEWADITWTLGYLPPK